MQWCNSHWAHCCEVRAAAEESSMRAFQTKKAWIMKAAMHGVWGTDAYNMQ